MLFEHPRVGLAGIIFKEGKLLVGKRKGSHGAETWSVPGGGWKMQESLEQGIQREVQEETGLTVVASITDKAYTQDFFPGTAEYSAKQYLTVFIGCRYTGGKPQLREPEKCYGWEWHPLENLPEPLFPPLHKLVHTQREFLEEQKR